MMCVLLKNINKQDKYKTMIGSYYKFTSIFQITMPNVCVHICTHNNKLI